MTDFQLTDTVDEEPPATADDDDVQTVCEPDTPDQETNDDGPKPIDDLEVSDQERAAGTTSQHRETVELAWIPAKNSAEMSIADGVEANARMIADTASEEELEGVKHTIEHLRVEVDELRGEIESLRDRIGPLERWNERTNDHLNGLSNDIRRLLTASELDIKGICPKCNGAPLEKKRPIGGMNRIECANKDCKYIAAEME